MFRKLTSFLFKEEEVVFEQDLNHEEKDDLHIPELKPMSAPKREIKKEVVVEPNFIEETPIEKAADIEEPRRKAVRIDADEPLHEVKEVKLKKEVVPKNQQIQYQRKEIISPMFGGTNTATSQESEPKKPSDVKKRTTKTTVISPMFGAVTSYEEETVEQEVDMDLDITEMLSPDRVDEDIQVSLYDFLEDFKDE